MFLTQGYNTVVFHSMTRKRKSIGFGRASRKCVPWFLSCVTNSSDQNEDIEDVELKEEEEEVGCVETVVGSSESCNENDIGVHEFDHSESVLCCQEYTGCPSKLMSLIL